MTPDERKMLSDLADKIEQTPAPPRDPEAEDFIRKNIGKRPDALYLMTQTVLIQNLALEQARRQIQELQQRSGGGQVGSGSFLGQGGYSQSSDQNYGAPQPQYSQPQYQSAPQPGSGAPSFLRGAAQTAAGVAAGALAFEGIRSLFSHPGYGMEGAGFGGFGGGFGGGPAEETIVNNYYDGPGGSSDSDLDLRDNRDNFASDDSDQYQDVDDSSDFDSSDDGGGDSGDDFS
jgi:uncharacterized protein